MIRSCLQICVAALIVGCASRAAEVDVSANPELPRMHADTYTLVIEDMPGFLAPLMREALTASLASRGATEVASDGDVEFRIVFAQLSLHAGELPPSGRFESTIAPEQTTRFVPRVELIAKQPGDHASLRIGTISRVHAVSAGVYMHPRSNVAIRRAFDTLLAEFLVSAD